MRRMTPLAIVDHCDVGKHCRLRLLVRITVLHRNPCRLSGMNEALRHRVGPPVPWVAHTWLYPVLGQELPGAVRAILTPTVRRQDAPCGGLALANRPRQRLVPQCRPPMVGHGPSADCPRAQRQHRGKLQPAFARGEVCHVPGHPPLLHVQQGGHFTWFSGARNEPLARGTQPPGWERTAAFRGLPLAGLPGATSQSLPQEGAERPAQG